MTAATTDRSCREFAASQLVLRERQCRDRGWFDEMRSCYSDDSKVRVSWFRGSGPDFIEASRAMSGRSVRSLHRLGAPIVRSSGDRFLVDVPATIVFTIPGEVPSHLHSWTRLVYRVEERASRPRIVTLDTIYERDERTPRPSDAPTDAEARPSYAALAGYLKQTGYAIGGDLLGDDRPEEVARFYGEALRWLMDGRVEEGPG